VCVPLPCAALRAQETQQQHRHDLRARPLSRSRPCLRALARVVVVSVCASCERAGVAAQLRTLVRTVVLGMD
jgi:hypothetical protein